LFELAGSPPEIAKNHWPFFTVIRFSYNPNAKKYFFKKMISLKTFFEETYFKSKQKKPLVLAS
jgi:hypothetical protein